MTDAELDDDALEAALELATFCYCRKNVLEGRRQTLEFPRAWVLERIESVVRETVHWRDVYQYRRLLQLAELLDADLLQRMVGWGLNDDKTEVRETAEDFLIDAKGMPVAEFVAWAVERGLPNAAAEQVARFAVTKNEYRKTCEIGPPPPVSTLDYIREMTERDGYYGLSPTAEGFIIVGSCPNGDPIAVDLRNEPGSVWYIAHDNSRPVRERAARVGRDVAELNDCVNFGGPYDYYDAKDKLENSDEADRA